MPLTRQWKGFGLTDIGRVRQTNQDALRINDELGLWIVADGMGGYAGGDIASHLAVESVSEFLAGSFPSKDQSVSMDWPPLLQSAVIHAHTAIRQRAKADPALMGMGTTLVLACMPPHTSESTFIVHVGDSRAYLLRDHMLSALTRDHTLLEERIQVGLLPRSTPASHKLGHVLTRAVGVEATVEPDMTRISLSPTDKLLLCSDGLIKMMSDDQILEVLEKNPAQTAHATCRELIERANALGGKDNTTVVLIQAQEHAENS